MSTAPSQPLSRRQEYAEATRNAVLLAAEKVFAGAGRADVSVDEIATSARVSKGTVYHHFGDKAGLFEAVYRRHLVWLAADMNAAVTRHADPWRQLLAAADAYLAVQVERKSLILLRVAPSVMGLERCRAIEGDQVLPCLHNVLQRLAGAKRLVPADVEVAGLLVLGIFREAALVAGERYRTGSDPAAIVKLVQATLRGLQRPPRSQR